MDLLNQSFKQIQPIATSNVGRHSRWQISHFLFSSGIDIGGRNVSNDLSTASFDMEHRSVLVVCNSWVFISIVVDPNEITDSFLALLNIFDDLDKTLNRIYDLFTALDISPAWLQSPLFDWKRVRIYYWVSRDENKTVLSIVDQHGQQGPSTISEQFLHDE